MIAADLEHSGRSAAYSSASSARTIHSDDPTCTVKEKSKKGGVQDVEKLTAAEKVEDAGPPADVGENPDGGLRAWLVVIGCASGICATFGLVTRGGYFKRTTRRLSSKGRHRQRWHGSAV
ncbi:hypothetical protein V8D89_008285 [Ganoderma adspersum]